MTTRATTSKRRFYTPEPEDCWLCGAKAYPEGEIYCRDCRKQDEQEAPQPQKPKQVPLF